LVGQTFGGAADAQQLEKAQQQVDTVLRFFEGLLGDKFFFCSSDGISLADVVAGVSVLGLPSLGLAWDGEHLIFVKTLLLAPSFFLLPLFSWLLTPDS